MSSVPRTPQEAFETPEARRAIIRSDRRSFVGVQSELEFPFGAFPVTNYSATGVAILDAKGDERFTKGEVYTASHGVEGFKVGSYQLSLARTFQFPTGEGVHVAFELKSGLVPIERIQTVIKLRRVLNGLAKELQDANKIPHEFKRIVLEGKLFLQKLEAQIQEMRAEKEYGSLEEIQVFEETLIPIIAEMVTQWSTPAHREMEASLKSVAEADLAACVNFYREQLKGMISPSPFAHRSAAKPLGYAGDFEMMNIIYRNEHVGNSLFGKCLHAYWLSHSEPKAVRNRSTYLYDRLVHLLRAANGSPLKIGSIACGPCREVQMILESAEELRLDLSNCEFHLVDQDIKALKYAHEKLWEIARTNNSPVKLNLVNKSTRHLIIRRWEESDFDLLYSAGLFDYFSDPVAQMAASVLFEHLKPGGQLIIGNFSRTAPNQFGMRLALDWNLIYRSPDDLRRLFGELGGVLSIEQEPEGVNLFCVIKKPETA